MISSSLIAEINRRLTGNNFGIYRNVSSCLSSYTYYKTKKEQIMSIVLNILKGHYFFDGNKRTAFSMFIILCVHNGIEFSVPLDMANRFVDMARESYTVEEVVEYIFD